MIGRHCIFFKEKKISVGISCNLTRLKTLREKGSSSCKCIEVACFTSLHPRLCTALDSLRFGYSCSDIETHSMKLSTYCFWANLMVTWSLRGYSNWLQKVNDLCALSICWTHSVILHSLQFHCWVAVIFSCFHFVIFNPLLYFLFCPSILVSLLSDVFVSRVQFDPLWQILFTQ